MVVHGPNATDCSDWTFYGLRDGPQHGSKFEAFDLANNSAVSIVNFTVDATDR